MKNIKPEIIASVSGVRGIYGKTLTPENIIRFVSAYLKNLPEKKDNVIVIGYDGRLHGEIIFDIVNSLISLNGFVPFSIGIAPTPTVQIFVEKINAAGGIIVTASHNPQEWNGLKFLGSDGTFLSGREMEKVKLLASKNDFSYSDVDSIPPYMFSENPIKSHIKLALSLKYIKPAVIAERKFKVVVDAVNASGSEIVPSLLRQLGCKVINLYCDGSGIFPHKPEPIPENLKKLASAVKKHKADIGIAVDPDADRLVIITEKGEPFIEENTITSIVNFILRHSGKKNLKVTVNLSTTRAVDDVAAKYGASVVRTPVGEINVVNEMKKNGSVVGGEGSGGVIIPPVLGGHFGRDSLLGIVIFLQEIAESKLSVSEYKKSLPKYKIEKQKINITGNPQKFIDNLINKNRKNKDCKITTKDGVKLDFKDYWLHYRKSNTEPIIRIIKETKIN